MEEERNTSNFEKNISKILDKVECKRVSVYTTEFDLYMFRMFFELTSKKGYLSDSIAFINKRMDVNVLTTHKYSIIKDIDKEYLKSIESYLKEQILFDCYTLLSVKDEHVRGILQENKIINCEYLDTIFPPSNDIEFSNLNMTSVGLYSVTSHKWSSKICKEIESMVGKNVTILDATSCVGGDTIGFSLKFSKVIAVEKDKLNYTSLLNNLNQYKIDNTETYNEDFLEVGDKLIKKYKPEVVYIDPPWSGRDYILEKNIDLFLNDVNIKDIVSGLLLKHKNIKFVVLKVPKNYSCELKYNKKLKLKKFDILFISNN